MKDDEIIGLSRKKRLISNVIAAAGLLIGGAVLLILAIFADSAGYSFGALVIPVILFTLFMILFLVAIIQPNTVAMYLSVLAFGCGIVTLLGNLEIAGYDMIYPFYILTFSFASLFTMLLSKEYSFHLKLILFFTAISGALMLQSIFEIPLRIVLAVIVLVVGITVLILALSSNYNRKGLK